MELKHPQAETTVKSTGQAAAELDALFSAILPSSLGFDMVGDRAFIRHHPLSFDCSATGGISARREGEL
jgi:hypothetical protein